MEKMVEIIHILDLELSELDIENKEEELKEQTATKTKIGISVHFQAHSMSHEIMMTSVTLLYCAQTLFKPSEG